MMQVQNPTSAILHWFDGLERDIRSTTAFLVMFSVPDVTTPDVVDDWEPIFRDWVSRELSAHQKMVGKAIIIRGLINFICRNNFTEEGRAKIIERNRRIAKSAHDDGMEDLATKTESMIKRIIALDPYWERAAAQWKELCEGAISDDSLEAFEHQSSILHWDRIQEQAKVQLISVSKG